MKINLRDIYLFFDKMTWVDAILVPKPLAVKKNQWRNRKFQYVASVECWVLNRSIFVLILYGAISPAGLCFSASLREWTIVWKARLIGPTVKYSVQLKWKQIKTTVSMRRYLRTKLYSGGEEKDGWKTRTGKPGIRLIEAYINYSIVLILNLAFVKHV